MVLLLTCKEEFTIATVLLLTCKEEFTIATVLLLTCKEEFTIATVLLLTCKEEFTIATVLLHDLPFPAGCSKYMGVCQTSSLAHGANAAVCHGVPPHDLLHTEYLL